MLGNHKEIIEDCIPFVLLRWLFTQYIDEHGKLEDWVPEYIEKIDQYIVDKYMQIKIPKHRKMVSDVMYRIVDDISDYMVKQGWKANKCLALVSNWICGLANEGVLIYQNDSNMVYIVDYLINLYDEQAEEDDNIRKIRDSAIKHIKNIQRIALSKNFY